MNVIVVVDQNWAIGYNGDQLVKIPEDLAFFKSKTVQKVVVMGRKTLEAFPGKKPLPGRTNIVLTRNPDYTVKGALIAHTIEEAKQLLQGYADDDIFIVGGEQIYRAFLEDCDTAYVTFVRYAYQADTFFPNLDQREDWILVEEGEEQTYFNLEYTFRRYEKKK